jgi:LacI family transcriptional regulator, galactose operon repressor
VKKNPTIVTVAAEAGVAVSTVSRFARPLDVTALVLANDALAFGFMRAAQQRGVRIPGDLSLAGFDGLPRARCSIPR